MKLTAGNLQEYKEIIYDDSRRWNFAVILHNSSSSVVLDSNVVKVKIDECVSDGSNITMGSVLTRKATVDLRDITSDILVYLNEGRAFSITASLIASPDSVPTVFQLAAGKYFIDVPKITKNKGGKDSVNVTAYDRTYLMTKKYIASSASLTANQIVSEIAGKYGLSVDESVTQAISAIDGDSPALFTPLADYTDKQTLGYIAGCYGCYAYLDEVTEAICFGWYQETDDTIEAALQYEGGFVVSDAVEREYVMLTTGTKETPVSYPNGAVGYAVDFENPYWVYEAFESADERAEAAQARAEKVFNGRLTSPAPVFAVGKVKYRGDPLINAGSVVTVTDTEGVSAAFFVMKRTLNFDGGLYEEIECQGDSEATVNYKAESPTMQRVKRELSRMEEAVKAATSAIKQTQGSDFELIPNENDETKNIGFKLHYEDATDPDFDDCVIVGTAGGIGFSTNNENSFSAAAIYFAKDENGIIRGYINGEFLTAGSVNADAIAAGSITAEHIQSDAITAEKIQSGAITADKLSVGEGELPELFYNGDFSKSTTSVPGWDGYNTVFRRHTLGVEAIYIDDSQNLIDEETSEFYSTNGWTGTNCTITKPYDNVDFIRIFPSSATTQAWVTTPVYLEKGKRYSIAAQINPYDWANTNSNFINSCMGYYCDGVLHYFPTSSVFSTPVTGEANINFVFHYDGESGQKDVGLFFGGMENSSGGATGINIAWVAINETERVGGFFTSVEAWLSDNFKESRLINGGTTIKTASEFIEFFANMEKSQVMFQKKYLENGKRYSLIAKLKVLELSTLAQDVEFGLWGQNSEGEIYAPEQVNSSGVNTANVIVKFVFDYEGETGFADLGIAWNGLKKASGEPCEVFFYWYRLYQDDTDELGFYASNADWLNDGYKESHLLSSADTAYNIKPALEVADNNLYFYGAVKSPRGTIGCLKYRPDGLGIENSTYYYEDASQPDLSGQAVYNSAISIIVPEGIKDAVGFIDAGGALFADEVIEYLSAKMVFELNSEDDTGLTENYKATITPYGFKAESGEGESLLLMPDGIGFNHVSKLSLAQIKYLIKNTPEA